jgi:hypothetical protein
MLSGRSFLDCCEDFLCVLGSLCSAPTGGTGGRGIHRRDAENFFWGNNYKTVSHTKLECS